MILRALLIILLKVCWDIPIDWAAWLWLLFR